MEASVPSPSESGSIEGPLVLTLLIDAQLQTYINHLRTTYFPPHRLLVPAHLTLFHALPSSQPGLNGMLMELDNIALDTPEFDIGLRRSYKLGEKGVGLEIGIGRERVVDMRKTMLQRWRYHALDLTNQDKRPSFNPHFTIMNKQNNLTKVEDCLKALSYEDLTGKTGKVQGIEVWEYMVGGRWRFIRSFGFRR